MTCIDKMTCRHLDEDIILQYDEIIMESTPVSTLRLKPLYDAIMRCETAEEAMEKLVDFLTIFSNTPCCNKPYTTEECMCIDCEACGQKFCGFCHLVAHEIKEDTMEIHVSLCIKNKNPVRHSQLGPHKSPYAKRHCNYFHLKQRVKIYNWKMSQIFSRFGGNPVDLHTQQIIKFIDVIQGVGGMYITGHKFRVAIKENDYRAQIVATPEMVTLQRLETLFQLNPILEQEVTNFLTLSVNILSEPNMTREMIGERILEAGQALIERNATLRRLRRQREIEAEGFERRA